MDIARIIDNFNNNRVLYSRHALIEMKTEEFGRIFENEVHEAVLSGAMIEDYPDDKPLPSMLILGTTKENRPIHIVCAYDQTLDQTIIITVYHPNSNLWIDYTRRRKP